MFAAVSDPAATFDDHDRCDSPFFQQATATAQSFLAELTQQTSLPNLSWLLATLPQKHGGLGFTDPAALAAPNFIRPLLRSICYATSGIPIPVAYPNPHPDPDSEEDEDNIHCWVTLPPTLTQPFTTWHSASSPTWTLFRQIAPSYLHLGSQDPISSLQDFISDPNLQISRTVHSIYQTRQLTYFDRNIEDQPSSIKAILPTLLAPLVNKALTTLPQSPAAYRIGADLYLLGLKRRLRLPILTDPIPCNCGRSIDVYTDHVFSCREYHKGYFHNRVRDALYTVCVYTAPHAGLTATYKDIALEPRGLLPRYPQARPGDIALRLQPGAVPKPVNILPLDVRSTAMPLATSNDSNISPVVRLHESMENSKLKGKSSRQGHDAQDYISHLLANKMALIPITVDPGGLLGPLASAFLWDKTHRPPTALPPSINRHKTGLSTPASKQAEELASSISNIHLLAKANAGFRKNHPGQPFCEVPGADTPLTWAHQILGINLLLASTLHIQTALSKANPMLATDRPLLSCNATPPTIQRPRNSHCKLSTFPNPNLLAIPAG